MAKIKPGIAPHRYFAVLTPVFLLPDVCSCPHITPSSLPGLGPEVFLLGRGIENAYFELREWHQNATFGMAARKLFVPLNFLLIVAFTWLRFYT